MADTSTDTSDHDAGWQAAIARDMSLSNDAIAREISDFAKTGGGIYATVLGLLNRIRPDGPFSVPRLNSPDATQLAMANALTTLPIFEADPDLARRINDAPTVAYAERLKAWLDDNAAIHTFATTLVRNHGQAPAAPVLVWHPPTGRPESGRKIVGLWSDGSGARLLWLHDHGEIDCEGHESQNGVAGFHAWAYLPDDYDFHCETGDEPMTLRPLGEARPAPIPVTAENFPGDLEEAVAQAICLAGGHDPDELMYHQNGDTPEPYGPRWLYDRPAAKAAIALIARSALMRQSVVPPGWRLVPDKPAPAMFGAGGVAQFKNDMGQIPVREAVGLVYEAMVAVAPLPPGLSTDAMVPVIARTILGPRTPMPVTCKWTLAELQEVRWTQQSTAQERGEAVQAAKAVVNTHLTVLLADRAATRDILIATTAALAGCTSAFEKYAGHVERRSVRDPFFKTRIKDHARALEVARAHLNAETAHVG